MTADSEAAQKRFKIWEVITEVYLQNSQRFQKNKHCWLLNRSRSPDWSLQYWIGENNSENCSLVRLVSVKYREESWCVPRCKVIIICLWWPGDDGEPVITGWPTSTLQHSTPLHSTTPQHYLHFGTGGELCHVDMIIIMQECWVKISVSRDNHLSGLEVVLLLSTRTSHLRQNINNPPTWVLWLVCTGSGVLINDCLCFPVRK